MSEDQQLNISLRPEKIFNESINNSLFTMIIVMVLLAILLISGLSRAKLVPGRWQGFWELVVESLLNLVENSMGRNKTSRRLFPLVATLFIFILFANWFSLLPGVGSIGFERRSLAVAKDGVVAANGFALSQSDTVLYKSADANSPQAGTVATNQAFKVTKVEGNFAEVEAVPTEATTEGTQADAYKPLEGTDALSGYMPVGSLAAAKVGRVIIPIIRPPNADLNMTLAMALIAVITANIIAILSHGVKGWLKEFFPKPYVMDPLLTPIEIISQFSRIISLTFRLFGNIFAGEALIAVILSIAAPVLIVFLGLELFFGFIQALVFASLTLAYLTLAFVGMGEVEGEHGHEDEEHGDHIQTEARESVGAL